MCHLDHSLRQMPLFLRSTVTAQMLSSGRFAEVPALFSFLRGRAHFKPNTSRAPTFQPQRRTTFLSAPLPPRYIVKVKHARTGLASQLGSTCAALSTRHTQHTLPSRVPLVELCSRQQPLSQAPGLRVVARGSAPRAACRRPCLFRRPILVVQEGCDAARVAP